MKYRITFWFSLYALVLTLAVSGNSVETRTPYKHHLIAADTGGAPTAATEQETARLYLEEISKQPNNRQLIKDRINSFNEMREGGHITDPELSYLFLSRAYAQLLGLPLSTFYNYPDFFKFVDVNEIWDTADNPDYAYGWIKAGPTAVPVLKRKDQRHPTRADPHWTRIRAQGKVDESGQLAKGWSFGPKGFEYSEVAEEPPEKPIKLEPIEEPTSFDWSLVDMKEYYWPSVSDGAGGIVDANCSDYYEENGTHYDRFGCHATQSIELMGLVVADKKRAMPEIEDLPTCPLADQCPADFEGFERIKRLEAEKDKESEETATNWQLYSFEELGFEVELPFEPDWKISDESESNVIDSVRSVGVDDGSPLAADVIVSSFARGKAELPSEEEFHSMLEDLAAAQMINEDESFEVSQLTYQGDDHAIKTVLKDANNKQNTSVYFVANNRIYALRIVVEKNADSQENTDRFLNSFKLIPLVEEDTNTPPLPPKVDEEDTNTPPLPPKVDEEDTNTPPLPPTVYEEDTNTPPLPPKVDEEAPNTPPLPPKVDEEAPNTPPLPPTVDEEAPNTPPLPPREDEETPVIPPGPTAFVPYASIAEFELLGRGVGADSPKEDDDRCQKGFDPVSGEHDDGCRAPTDDDFNNWPYLKDVKNIDKPIEELKTP